MYDDILVPTDGSDSVMSVLDHTTDIATRRDATVHVLYVIDDQAFLTLDDEMKDEVLAEMQAEGEQALDAVTEETETAGLETVTSIRRGRPAEEIVDYAETAGIDVITMGTQGDDYTENILGSTSQKVVTQSPVPVLTVDVSGE
ncbi:universal stress protein [Halovenus sp. WSH3]|uniref:Universal stress protein n=1 Tax=Halovenus carboxidivorans TaxID=2692199 RepID=A0A6B0SZM9_9EURY|nr:universal stress protein [Halovenus carboxidivorans]MXR50975.1 universal stress protein [Halovenus carboxidivorans]